MELLDRYLQAVKKHLPWREQNDVIAELRANLEAELEEREAGLGRPMTAIEAAAWLREVGPPIQVAGRYQPQRYLIGPTVYPLYFYVLRIALVWSLAVYAAVCTSEIFTGAIRSAGGVATAFFESPGVLLTTAAWVTLTFAVLEAMATRFPGRFPALAGLGAAWAPERLPAVAPEDDAAGRPQPLWKAVAEVVVGSLYVVYVVLIPHFPYLLLGPGASYLRTSPYELAPVWTTVFWWVVGLNAAPLALRVVALARGSWRTKRPWLPIVLRGFGVVPLLLLLTVREGASVVLRHPAVDAARYGRTLAVINLWVNRSALFWLAVILLGLAISVGKLALAGYRKNAAKMGHGTFA